MGRQRSANFFQRNFLKPSKPIGPSSSLLEKNRFCFSKFCDLLSPSRLSRRGVSRSSRTLGGMRWTRRSVRRALAVADGEAVWFWRPDAGAKFATTPTRRANDGVNKAGPREERGASRKTIAWGMPDVSGASAVNTHAHTRLPPARMRLRVHWAPGIPRALLHEGDEIPRKARAQRRGEIATSYAR
jgi:hypothetical protein